MSQLIVAKGCIFCGAPPGTGYPGKEGLEPICLECSKAVHELMPSVNRTDPTRVHDREYVVAHIQEMERIFADLREYMKGRIKWYAPEAYKLVREAVRIALAEPEKLADPSHMTAVELLDVLRIAAIDKFGRGARAQLQEWGVTRCEDFGEIVFRLIACSQLGAQEGDTREDFNGGYDFATAFPD